MNIVYGIYGAGGFGQQVLGFFKRQFSEDRLKDINFYYIDDNCPLNLINGNRKRSFLLYQKPEGCYVSTSTLRYHILILY